MICFNSADREAMREAVEYRDSMLQDYATFYHSTASCVNIYFIKQVFFVERGSLGEKVCGDLQKAVSGAVSLRRNVSILDQFNRPGIIRLQNPVTALTIPGLEPILWIIQEERMIKKDDMPICEAANYFKEEILEIMPDIPIDRLADMVSLYIYYQYGITKEEAKSVIEKTCF
jgi:hypothetical protein